MDYCTSMRRERKRTTGVRRMFLFEKERKKERKKEKQTREEERAALSRVMESNVIGVAMQHACVRAGASACTSLRKSSCYGRSGTEPCEMETEGKKLGEAEGSICKEGQ